MSVENVFSNENYINKDFQQVYQEVVDTIGKLNNKYLVDGEGDENDPMVILIKCLAGAVDKLSYNTDKNILENYPETLQQEISARRVFSPVYNMKWYMSAHGEIVIQNLKEKNEEEGDDGSIEIPQFLMVSSGDNGFVYTITQGDTLASGEIKVFPVTEGKIKTLTINGSDQITIDKFVDNKIYLDDYNVAENGIFVTPYNLINNQDTLSYVWEQVDNLDVADWRTNSENGGQYYEFRVDLVTGRPYLRFVDDLVDKIGDGLRIRYIISNGEEGNISAGKLTNVYATDAETTVDSEQLKILNLLPILNGQNPESIESARHNYFKNIDICNTLVTLRDYANAIYLGDGLVSNCFVCDKNNDVQYSYKIATANGDITKYEETNGNDLTVYNLKFYGLTHNNIADTDSNTFDDEKASFTNTFEIINPVDTLGNPINIPQKIENYIDDIKSINHEFASIRNENRISMIKDYYTLSINLLFRQQLSEEQQNDVKNNVLAALYENLNAHALDFGERVTYNKVQEIIYGADQRILGASIYGLDDVNFNANAVFWSPYIPVYYSPLGENGVVPFNGEYAVFPNAAGNLFSLYQCTADNDSTVWTEISGSAISLPQDPEQRKHDLYGLSDMLCVIYDNTMSWQVSYAQSKSIVDGDVAVCLSVPTAPQGDGTVVHAIKKTQGPLTEIPDGAQYSNVSYPSSPVAIPSVKFSGDSFWIKYANKYYQFELVKKSFVVGQTTQTKYMTYNYDEAMYFVYNGNNTYGSSGNPGYFHEAFIGSEIVETSGVYDDNFDIIKNGIVSLGVTTTEIVDNASTPSTYGGLSGIPTPSGKESLDTIDSDSAVVYGGKEFIWDGTYWHEYSSLVGVLQTDIYAKSVLAGKTPIFEQNTKSVVNFKDEKNFENNNIKYIKPNLELLLTSEYLMGDNEYIQILTPELEVIANYSFYVYMGYYSSTASKQFITIEKNQDYEIEQNDLIVFYYRASDEENYSYNVYGPGNIICPSKKITLYNLPVNSNARNVTSGVAPNYWNTEISKATKESITANRLTALKSTDSCDVKHIQKNAIQYYSFVTANKTASGNADVYSITFTDDESSAKQYYVIEDGESFTVYKNASGGETIAVLGAGTILTMPIGDNKTITSTTGKIETASDPNNFEYLLCQINQITPNTYVKPILYATIESPEIEEGEPYSTKYSDQVAFNSAPVTNKVVLNQSTTGIIVPPGTSGTNVEISEDIVKIVHNQISTTDWSFSTEQTESIQVKYINSDETIAYFYIEFDITPTQNVHLSGDFERYSRDYVLRYIGESSEYETIQHSLIGGFVQLIRSALLVDIDNSAQEVKTFYTDDSDNRAKQSIIGYSEDSIEYFDVSSNVEISTTDVVENEIYSVSCESAVYAIGGKQQIQESDFYVAQERSGNYPSSGTSYTNYSNNTVVIDTGSSNSVTIDLPTSLSDIGYVLYFSCLSSSATITIKIGDQQSTDIANSLYGEAWDNKQISKGSMNTVLVDLSEYDSITIINHGDSQIKLSFQSVIYPYSYKTQFGTNSESITNIILHRMGELDTNNQYQLRSNKDYVITNPLASSAFLNKEHPYNPFTICQMNPDVQWR